MPFIKFIQRSIVIADTNEVLYILGIYMWMVRYSDSQGNSSILAKQFEINTFTHLGRLNVCPGIFNAKAVQCFF